MNKAQQNGIEKFKRFIEQQHVVRGASYGAAITVWEVKPTDYGTLWINAQVELLGLPSGNLLRALDHTSYFVSVGKRGALTAHVYPSSLEQFKGGSFLGINIK